MATGRQADHRLTEIRAGKHGSALIAGKHGNPAIVKQELARHIDLITLLPDGDKTIVYKGNWKLLGVGDREYAEGGKCTKSAVPVNLELEVAA